MVIKWYKKLAVPASWNSNSVYFIKNGNYIDMYVTDIEGMPSHLPTMTEIEEMLEAALSGVAGVGVTAKVVVTESRNAVAEDAGKYIFLDGSEEAVDYTIDPAE